MFYQGRGILVTELEERSGYNIEARRIVNTGLWHNTNVKLNFAQRYLHPGPLC